VTNTDHEQVHNVRVRLALRMNGPAVGEGGGEIEIWITGSRFRIWDHTGRLVSEILEDVEAPRGLGPQPTSMSAIMDIYSARHEKRRPPTEMFGDLESGEGLIVEPYRTWSLPAAQIADIAHQIFSNGQEDVLERVGETRRFGRACIEYRGVIEGQTGGATWRNAHHRIVTSPYVLFDDVRDAASMDHYYIREVTRLEEGVVTAEDVSLPLPVST